VKSDVEDLLLKVSEVDGVINVVATDNGFEFETLAGQDCRPDVARVIIQSGADLLEFHQVNMSLEDIFLQLTQDEIDLSSDEQMVDSSSDDSQMAESN